MSIGRATVNQARKKRSMTPTARRWTLLAAAVLLLLGTVAAWRSPRVRHEVWYELSKRQRALDGSPTSPPGPPGPIAATPHLLHAGKPAPGFLANSERSLRAAAARARGVEVDVGFSRDLVPYLSHEDDLGLLRGGAPDRLSKHDAADLDAMTFTDGSRPMRLEAFARELLPRFERVVFDLKTRQDRAEAKARALLAALGTPPPDHVQFIGNPGPVLLWLKALAPTIPGGCETYGPDASRLAGLDVFSARASEVTLEADRKAREAGLHRLYWTATSAGELARIQAWRPDAILVDLADAGADALPAEWRRAPPPGP